MKVKLFLMGSRMNWRSRECQRGLVIHIAGPVEVLHDLVEPRFLTHVITGRCIKARARSGDRSRTPTRT